MKAVLVLFLAYATAEAKIPDYIHVCKRNNPNIAKCITKSIEALKPKLIEGVPELDIPPIEPLHLPDVQFSLGSGFKVNASNIVVRGASNFDVKDLKADVKNIVYIADIYIPNVNFDASYDVDGKILTLPIKGKGPFTANATDVNGKAVIKGHIKTRKDGRKFVPFDELDLKLDLKDYQFRLDNLFGGDKRLGEAVNKALNDNKRDVMDLFQPVLEQIAAKVLLDRANRITRHFTYDELFPLD